MLCVCVVYLYCILLCQLSIEVVFVAEYRYDSCGDEMKKMLCILFEDTDPRFSGGARGRERGGGLPYGSRSSSIELNII